MLFLHEFKHSEAYRNIIRLASFGEDSVDQRNRLKNSDENLEKDKFKDVFRMIVFSLGAMDKVNKLGKGKSKIARNGTNSIFEQNYDL